MNALFKYIVFISLVVFFSACGGSGGDESTATPTIPLYNIAYFVDGPVVNLPYHTQSIQSTTKSDGSFEYTNSDVNVTFSIGSIVLGTIAIKDINSDKQLYIQDLVKVPRNNLSDPTLLKIASFLQSLDTGTDVSSITLNKNDMDSFTEANKTISNIDLSIELAKVNKSLKKTEDVIEHLGNTMRLNNIALYNYTPQAQNSTFNTLTDTTKNGQLQLSDKNDKFLDIYIDKDVSHGNLSLIKNTNTFTYTPNSGYQGTDSFSYFAFDGEKFSHTATVSINVQGITSSNSDTIIPKAPLIVSLTSQYNAISLFWLPATDETTSSSNLRYEIYLSQTPNFDINTSTPSQTILGSLETTIDDLNPDTLYYIKIKVLDEANNVNVSSEHNISTSNIAVLLNNNINLNKATELHLENAKVESDRLIYKDSSRASLPDFNSSMSNIIIGNKDDAYLRKITSVTRNGDKMEIQTTDASITDVISDAKITSETTLFNLDTINPSSSPKRSVAYNNNNTKVDTLTWPSDHLSISETQNRGTLHTGLKPQRIQVHNSEFKIDIGSDDVITTINGTVYVYIKATMLEGGIRKNWKFNPIELVSLTNPNKSDINNFEARLINIKTDTNSVSAYLKWTPSKDDASLDKYIAKFKVTASEPGGNGQFGVDQVQTIESKILVTSDSKLTLGNKKSFKLNDQVDFTNAINLTFTPKLLTENRVLDGKLTYAKVEVTGKLDLSVFSTLKFSASDTKTYNRPLTKKTIKKLILVGQIPLYQEIIYTLDANLTATATGNITATSDLQTDFEVKAGLVYENEVWTPLKDTSHHENYTATVTTAGGVVVDVRLIPNIELKYYKVASAGLSLEPWLQGNIQASASQQYTTNLKGSDTLGLYKLDDLNVTAGLEGKIYMDLSIWKYELTHYPSSGGKVSIFNPTLDIFNIPRLKVTDNRVDICSDNPYKLLAIAKNPTSLIKNDFVKDSIKWIVFPSDGAFITPDANKSNATFNFSKQNLYTVYMIGSSSALGNYAKQYASFNIDTRGCTIIPNSDDYGDNISDAHLFSTSSLDGYINTQGDKDYFKIVIPKNKEATVYTTGTLDTFANLYTPRGEQSDFNNGTDENKNFSMTIPEGTWYIKVSAFDQELNPLTGAYTLHQMLTDVDESFDFKFSDNLDTHSVFVNTQDPTIVISDNYIISDTNFSLTVGGVDSDKVILTHNIDEGNYYIKFTNDPWNKGQEIYSLILQAIDAKGNSISTDYSVDFRHPTGTYSGHFTYKENNDTYTDGNMTLDIGIVDPKNTEIDFRKSDGWLMKYILNLTTVSNTINCDLIDLSCEGTIQDDQAVIIFSENLPGFDFKKLVFTKDTN